MLETAVNSQFQFDKSLILWVTVKGESGATYYVVSDTLRREYYLYKVKKKRAERDADLQRIHDLLDEFNKKYDDCLNVNRCQNTTEDWIETLFRCL